MADCPDQQAGVAVVDAGDGVAEADGAWSARLAASRSILRSPPELGSSPASSARIAVSQSMLANSVAGSLMLVPTWMKRVKSSRASQDAWAMISPVAGLDRVEAVGGGAERGRE
jgi:hypothetical protein